MPSRGATESRLLALRAKGIRLVAEDAEYLEDRWWADVDDAKTRTRGVGAGPGHVDPVRSGGDLHDDGHGESGGVVKGEQEEQEDPNDAAR